MGRVFESVVEAYHFVTTCVQLLRPDQPRCGPGASNHQQEMFSVVQRVCFLVLKNDVTFNGSLVVYKPAKVPRGYTGRLTGIQRVYAVKFAELPPTVAKHLPDGVLGLPAPANAPDPVSTPYVRATLYVPCVGPCCIFRGVERVDLYLCPLPAG